jgi:hypothetical protein
MGVAFNQSGKENHPICVYGLCLLALRKIGSRTHIGSDPILDPDGLAFDKLSGMSIKKSAIDENGIWRSVARNEVIELHHLVHLSLIERDSIPAFFMMRFYQNLDYVDDGLTGRWKILPLLPKPLFS